MLTIAVAIFAVGVMWELRIMRRRLHALEHAVDTLLDYALTQERE